ncbi:MAG: helix-turn-helix domain-containing protein [Thermoactinomyces sp.]
MVWISPQEQKWLGQLERVIGAEAKVVKRSEGASPVFYLPSGTAFTFEIPLSPRECALVELWLQDRRVQEEGMTLPDWFRSLDKDGGEIPIPPEISKLPWKERVPFYIQLSSPPIEMAYEPTKLFKAYFGEETTWVISVHEHEWLILAALSSFVEGTETKRSLEKAAEDLCEVIASEAGTWIRVLVHPPINHAHEAAHMWSELKRASNLSRIYYPERQVMATWKLELEKLITQLDDRAVSSFLQSFPSLALLKEPEIEKTLKTLFEFDLNISETARHLYIHRNTLLYRLDRIKQETGYDVRSFADAVLVKIMLLLLQKNTE